MANNTLDWLKNLLPQSSNERYTGSILPPNPEEIAAMEQQTPPTAPSIGMADSVMARSGTAMPPLNDGMATSLAARASPLESESLDPAQIAKVFAKPYKPKTPPTHIAALEKVHVGPEQSIIEAKEGDLLTRTEQGKNASEVPKEQTEEEMLKEAQGARDQNLLLANLARAGKTIGSGIATPGEKVDYTFTDELAKQAGLPVEKVREIMAVRKAQREKEKEALEAEKTKGEIAQQKTSNEKAIMELKKAKEAQDPNHPMSVLVKDTLRKVFNGKVQIPDSLSLAQIPDTYLAVATHYMSHEDNIAMRKEVGLQRAQEKKDLQEKKDQENRLKLYSQAAKDTDLTNMKPFAKGAFEASRIAGSALSYIDKYGANLNKMTPQDVAILASDVAKLSTGSVATKKAFEEVMYPSIRQEFSKELQKFSSHPTPANAAEFILKYKEQLENIQKHNNAIFTAHVKQNLEPYKKRIDPEDYERLTQLNEASLNAIGASLNEETKAPTRDPKTKAKIDQLMKNNPGISEQQAYDALKSKGML